MKRLFLFILAFTCLFFTQSVKGQATFSFINVVVNDTDYYYNDNILVDAQLLYTGSASFTGNFTAGYAVVNAQDTLYGLVPNYNEQLVLQGGAAADTSTLSIPVSPSFFLEGGGHTVIVWPIINNTPPVGSTTDSTEFNVNILGWLKQNEFKLSERIKIYPIPAMEVLYLDKPETNAEISIIDCSGKVLSSFITTEKTSLIPIAQLRPGVYFVRYLDKEKNADIQRFIKQ